MPNLFAALVKAKVWEGQLTEGSRESKKATDMLAQSCLWYSTPIVHTYFFSLTP